MLSQRVHELSISSRGRGFTEFTPEVEKLVHESGFETGIATLHLRHTSASLLIQENADPSVRVDFETYFTKLVKDADPMFVHNYEGDDDMAAHIRTALTTVNLSIPIVRGSLALGTWQGIYLWEHRYRGHRRQVVVHLLGE